MTFSEQIRLIMQTGTIFVLLSFIQISLYLNIHDAAILEPDSITVKFLIFSGLWLWPLILTIAFVLIFPSAGRLSHVFAQLSLGKILTTTALLTVMVAFLTFSFLEVNKKIGIGIGREKLILGLLDRCLAKTTRIECHKIDIKKCVTSESNYKENFDDVNLLNRQPKILKRFQAAFAKSCPNYTWIP